MDNIDEGNDDLSASVTVNSAKFMDVNCSQKSLNKQLTELKKETTHLMQDLLESHILYQVLLKSIIDEQRSNIDRLRNLSIQSHDLTSVKR